jgi:hypothetical protein
LDGETTEQNVDVVKNFNVVAKKANGLKDECLNSLSGYRLEGFLDGGAYPWTAAGTLTLEGKPPAGNLGHASGDKLSRVAGFISVGVGTLSSWPETRFGLQRCVWGA